MANPQFTVLGAGSWGTALAALLARNGHAATLWGRDIQQMRTMQVTQENSKYLPGLPLPPTLNYTHDLTHAIAQADTIVLAVPSHNFRDYIQKLSPWLSGERAIIWACKGLEKGTAKLLHEIALEELPSLHRVAVISGPTFAKEVLQGLPSAATVAAEEADFASLAASWFQGESFRTYANTDIIGVEIGGALKNVLAIAAGIADGLGFGANTRAALITRGLAELMRLGEQLGGQRETLMGLSGLGDLVLTCTDNLSRNRRFGLALARGLNTEQAIQEIGQAVEGIYTTAEAYRLSDQKAVDMPIVNEVYDVLYQDKDPLAAVHSLLARAPVMEAP